MMISFTDSSGKHRWSVAALQSDADYPTYQSKLSKSGPVCPHKFP
jgi:hypothetical protein